MNESISDSPLTAKTALRALAIIGTLAFALSGCAPSAVSNDGAAEPSTSTEGQENSGDEDSSADDETATDSDEVTVIGGDLPDSTVLLLATIYAKGRDPQPTVEFLDATTVRFSFPAGLSESDAIGNCQIAYGALNGEGVRVFTKFGDAEQDCTAYVEG
jgi:hypothetical protein